MNSWKFFFFTGGCGEVSTSSFNKGLNAFVVYKQMLKGTGWDVPARALRTAFLNAGHVQAEGTTECGQSRLYSPYSTACERPGRYTIALPQQIHAQVLALCKAASGPSTMLNSEHFKMGEMLSTVKPKAITEQNGARQCSASSSSWACQSSEGSCELNCF